MSVHWTPFNMKFQIHQGVPLGSAYSDKCRFILITIGRDILTVDISGPGIPLVKTLSWVELSNRQYIDEMFDGEAVRVHRVLVNMLTWVNQNQAALLNLVPA